MAIRYTTIQIPEQDTDTFDKIALTADNLPTDPDFRHAYKTSAGLSFPVADPYGVKVDENGGALYPGKYKYDFKSSGSPSYRYSVCKKDKDTDEILYQYDLQGSDFSALFIVLYDEKRKDLYVKYNTSSNKYSYIIRLHDTGSSFTLLKKQNCTEYFAMDSYPYKKDDNTYYIFGQYAYDIRKMTLTISGSSFSLVSSKVADFTSNPDINGIVILNDNLDLIVFSIPYSNLLNYFHSHSDYGSKQSISVGKIYTIKQVSQTSFIAITSGGRYTLTINGNNMTATKNDSEKHFTKELSDYTLSHQEIDVITGNGTHVEYGKGKFNWFTISN